MSFQPCNGEGKVYLGTKDDDSIVGNWTHHIAQDLGNGMYGLKLTNLTYNGSDGIHTWNFTQNDKENKIKSDAANLVPFIGLHESTLIFSKTYQTQFEDLMDFFQMGQDFWCLDHSDQGLRFCTAE